MANVDREMAALGEERAEKSKRLNLKRMQHVSTLQQLSEFFLWKWSTTHSVWKFINGLIRISREIVMLSFCYEPNQFHEKNQHFSKSWIFMGNRNVIEIFDKYET